MRRIVYIASAGLLLALTGIGFFYRGDLSYYWNLWRTARAGERFYKNYEYIQRNVAFTDESDVRLDVYSPETGENHPVLLFVHGGGWDKYDRLLFAPVAMKLVPRNVVVVIPDYTLHPRARYEQMTREMADATAWVLENIERYGGDPSRVALSGHSAGGHLSGLVAFDDRWLQETGHDPSELCGWVGLSGVYDVDAQMAFERTTGGTAPVMTAVMGGEENFSNASPISYVDGAGPRSRLIHGALDDTVPLSTSEAMQGELDRAGVASELIVYSGEGHSTFLFDALANDDAPVLRDLVSFMRECSR